MSDEESLVRLDSDESVAQYLYRLPRDRQETHDILTRRVNMPINVEDDNALWLAAVERTTGVFVGEFMLRWVATEHRQGEIGGAIGGVTTLGVVTVGGLAATCGAGVGGAWGIRCNSLGVSSTTFTVPGSDFLTSFSSWVRNGKPAPIMACKAIDPRMAI